MIVERYTGGFTATHGYLVTTEAGSILIDAPEGITAWLKSRNVTPVALLLTHQHFDHVIDAGALQAEGVPVFAWSAFSTALTLEDHARQWGLPIAVAPYRVDELLEGRDELAVAEVRFSLLPVPGHSPDSVVFYAAKTATAFAGDTLFADSIGRTDLPHGDHESLLKNIRQHLFSLPETTRILPGHGGETTIGRERRENPYVRPDKSHGS